MEQDIEQLWSNQSAERWKRRKGELTAWIERPKFQNEQKKLMLFDDIEVDASIYPALMALKKLDFKTEYSCAGVSILDEPEDHSLYAYVTLIEGPNTDQFVKYAMQRMGYRLLVTYEGFKHRYDLSSFYISQNRSFCYGLELCAKEFSYQMLQP
ncbi:hypothetical protein [Paenibacillus sp. Marseille-Q7038]